ncbi:MAG: hypothetical protein BV457_01175 [Thermoplasmata archaeon M9B1D]
MYKKKPLVTVVIPTYNPKEILKRALKSVEKQTYKNIEVIVVDDNYPETKDESFFSEFKLNIKYICLSANKGACYARNKGIEESKGEFIAFLDDDDVFKETKIEKQVNHMLLNPSCPLVICFTLDLRVGKGRLVRPPEIITHKSLLKGFKLSTTSSYLARKSALNQIKKDEGYYFDTNLATNHEYDLALRLSENNDIYCLQEALMIRNKSEGQLSENWTKKIKGQLLLFKKYYKEYSKLGFKGLIFQYIRFIGLLTLFTAGFILGNRIYKFMYLIIGITKK